MKALLIVDVQNDFCTGGALAVYKGEEVTHIINKIAAKFDIVIASKDWHPEKTIHFEKWPVHCVQYSKGAEFHPSLNTNSIQQVFLKGTDNADDGYSAFEATNLNLTGYLKEHGIADVYVCGLATDYCVKATALDAVESGFNTYVVTDAVKAVNISPNDGDEALLLMEGKGCVLINSSEI